jgi:hypothetical protein
MMNDPDMKRDGPDRGGGPAVDRELLRRYAAYEDGRGDMTDAERRAVEQNVARYTSWSDALREEVGQRAWGELNLGDARLVDAWEQESAPRVEEEVVRRYVRGGLTEEERETVARMAAQYENWNKAVREEVTRAIENGDL